MISGGRVRTEIRFSNLPLLLKDMEQSEWTIDAFGFRYKGRGYVVILQLYGDREPPVPYAKAAVEFCREEDLTDSILAWIDFYEVHFFSSKAFCQFFDVRPGAAMRDLFLDFSEIFAHSIPKERNRKPTQRVRAAMLRRCEGNDPDAIYCCGVIRNGTTSTGSQRHRRIENSNKAALACPLLYERLREDTTLSFCFSADPSKAKSEEAILAEYIKRKRP